MKPDYTLYLVTDRCAMSTRPLTEAVEPAIAGGCTMIQLREAETSALAFYQLAVDIKAVTDRHHIPLIINNRIDIALAIGAAGVHLGQNDIPTAAARRIIGPNMLLGISVTTTAQALRAQAEGADYLGVGAMFPTKTKPDASIVSMEEPVSYTHLVSIGPGGDRDGGDRDEQPGGDGGEHGGGSGDTGGSPDGDSSGGGSGGSPGGDSSGGSTGGSSGTITKPESTPGGGNGSGNANGPGLSHGASSGTSHGPGVERCV